MSDPAPKKPLPRIDAISAPFWRAAAAGRLAMQRCPACSGWTFPPRPGCVECGEAETQWTPLTGRGRVYSFTIIRQAIGGHARAFDPDIPYVVAWIDLDEGPRMVSNIVDCPVDEVTIGMAVEVAFEAASADIHLPKFRPARAGD